MSKDYKVDAESAELEFERFADLQDLDLDTSVMDDEDKKSFDDAKRKVILAIQKGALIFDDDGLPVFTPIRSEDKTPIKFREPSGSTVTAMDRRKKGEDMAKTIAALAQLTQEVPQRYNNMSLRDLKVCTALFGFLGD